MADNLIHILVLDDDPALLAVLEITLSRLGGNEVTAVSTADAALTALHRQPFDLFVTDYSLDDTRYNGLDMLRESQTLPSKPLVIIITAFATLEITLEAIKLGSYDFLTKPFQVEELQLVVRNAMEQIRLDRSNRELRLQVTTLADAIDQLAVRQTELIERLRQLAESFGAPREELPQMAQSLNGAAVFGLQRRQAREKLSGYARVAETLLDEVRKQQSQIRLLYECGCLGEDDYRRLMAGKTARS
ncbi:response regulator [bacterium]|nr:response regulator [bacterium]